MPHLREFFLLIVTVSLGACETLATNQSFPVTVEKARADLRRMKEQPVPLMRPLVIVAGHADPGLGPALLAGEFRHLTGDDRIATVVLPVWASMQECRRLLVNKVEKQFPCPDPEHTVEVDVIGLSMGGVVARYGASGLPPSDQDSGRAKRLRPKRLFTISSPHRETEISLPATHNTTQGPAFGLAVSGSSQRSWC